ncbi:MAG: NRDE family protein, partial [Bacillales bacterium]
MCLILLAYKVHPDYKLIVAANRDEFYKRSTAPAHF